MATSTGEGDSPRLSKFQIALLIGTPVAAGFIYWYWKNRNAKKSKPGCEDIYENNTTNSGRTVTNKFNYAKKEYANVDEIPCKDAKDFKDKGNKFFKLGKFDKAIECYTEAIEMCPSERTEDLATFYQNRAAANENLKNYEAVINDTTKALELNKTYLKALHRRAKAYDATEQLDKCLEDLTALCMYDAFRTDTYLKLTDKVLKQLSKKEAKETFSKRVPRLPSKHYIRHYYISFSEDPIMKSVEEYKKQIKERNLTDMSGYRLAIHHLAEENYEEVMPACDVEIERNGPDLAEALLIRATFKILQGQIQDSLNDCNQLLALESVDVKVKVNCLIKVGSLKVQLEKMEEAIEDFDKAIALDLNNADIYLHRGQVFVLMERLQECLQNMEKSCSLNPNFPSARAQKCYIQYRCGIIFNDENQKIAALKEFEDIEKNFPGCPESFFLYAQVLMEIGEYEKSEKYFKKAGELDPNDPNVFVHQGILVLQWKEDIEKAIEHFNKAIEMDDKCQFGYESLGSVEVQRGNIRRGLELFQKAVDAAHTETELAHMYSLLLAAKAQAKVAEQFGMNTG